MNASQAGDHWYDIYVSKCRTEATRRMAYKPHCAAGTAGDYGYVLRPKEHWIRGYSSVLEYKALALRGRFFREGNCVGRAISLKV